MPPSQITDPAKCPGSPVHRADERIRGGFLREDGPQYDFPQKKWKTSMMMYLVGWMMGNKKLKAKMGDKMNEGMIASYKKILEEV